MTYDISQLYGKVRLGSSLSPEEGLFLFKKLTELEGKIENKDENNRPSINSVDVNKHISVSNKLDLLETKISSLKKEFCSKHENLMFMTDIQKQAFGELFSIAKKSLSVKNDAHQINEVFSFIEVAINSYKDLLIKINKL